MSASCLWRIWALWCWSSHLPPTTSIRHHDDYYFSGSINQINPFFYKVVLVMVFYHINRKVTKIAGVSCRQKMQIGTFGWRHLSVGPIGQKRGKNSGAIWIEMNKSKGRSVGADYERTRPHCAIESKFTMLRSPRGGLPCILNLNTSNEFGLLWSTYTINPNY